MVVCGEGKDGRLVCCTFKAFPGVAARRVALLGRHAIPWLPSARLDPLMPPQPRTAPRRTLVGEAWLQSTLREATARLRAQLPAEQRRRLEQRDAEEQRLLLRGGAQLSPAALAALPGRTTGDAAWLAARGEDGQHGAAAMAEAPGSAPAAAAAAGASGTRYRLAKDEGLAAVQPLRLCGGAVRASGENAPGETARHAFDGSPRTKWLDFGGRARNAAWLEYRLPAEAPPAVLGRWVLTSANDEPARDPRHVVLEAWSEGAAQAAGSMGQAALCKRTSAPQHTELPATRECDLPVVERTRLEGGSEHAWCCARRALLQQGGTPAAGQMWLPLPPPLQRPVAGSSWMRSPPCTSLRGTTVWSLPSPPRRRRRPPAASGCGWYRWQTPPPPTPCSWHAWTCTARSSGGNGMHSRRLHPGMRSIGSGWKPQGRRQRSRQQWTHSQQPGRSRSS